MKTVSDAFRAILFGPGPLLRADLLTITTSAGLLLRYTNADIDLIVGGITYSHALNWSRKGTTQSIGTSPDEIDLELYDNGSTPIAGAALMKVIAAGLLNNATIQVDKMVLSDWRDTTPGACGWFYGYVSTSSSFAGVAKLVVKSMVGRLGISMPRTIVQPQCNNAFGDASCGFNVSTVTFNFTCTGGSKLQPQVSGMTDHQFDQGKIKFITGVNAGVTRTVQWNAAGVIQLAYPLPFLPAPGDSFNISQGCARTQAACDDYNNRPNFKGMPYVPVASTALEGVSSPSGSTTDTGVTGVAVSGSTTTARKAPATYAQ